MDVKSSLIVYRSASAIFTFIRKFENFTHYAANISQAELVDPAALRRGSQFHAVQTFWGFPVIQADYQIVEFEENFRIVLKGESRYFTSRITLTLGIADAGVRLTARNQLELTGYLNIFDHLLARNVESSLRTSLENIKTALEKA